MLTIRQYREKLASIQWITRSVKFNERQLISIGDAVAAFYDCIAELEKNSKGKEIKIDHFFVPYNIASNEKKLLARKNKSIVKLAFDHVNENIKKEELFRYLDTKTMEYHEFPDEIVLVKGSSLKFLGIDFKYSI